MGNSPVTIGNFGGCAVARFARSIYILIVNLGSASLHPRLYASTRRAGLEDTQKFAWVLIPTQEKILACMGDDIGARLS